ncbi:unnamed protein product, partial [Porites evermanni]
MAPSRVENVIWQTLALCTEHEYKILFFLVEDLKSWIEAWHPSLNLPGKCELYLWLFESHDVFLCREVVNLDPFTSKKGSNQRSGKWEKIAQTFNEYTVLRFSVDKRSVRDHIGILVNKDKRKLRAKEKASGIAPGEPSELENLLDTIIALEKS